MGQEMKIRGKFPVELPTEYNPEIGPVTGLDIIRDAMHRFEYWDRALLCQEKMDGWFGILIKENNKCRWVRGWKEYGMLQEALKQVEEYLPDDSIVVCEVMYGTPYGSAMAERLGYVRVYITDVLKWNGKVVAEEPTGKRFLLLSEYFRGSNFKTNGHLCLVRTLPLKAGNPEESKRKAWVMFNDIYREGGEGLILKDISIPYVLRSKTKYMWKVKKYEVKSYVVMGFQDSSAVTYHAKGMEVSSLIGGLYVDGKLKEATKTSGFDFDWRKKFTDNPEEYIGKVVDIAGNEIFKDGAMRHSTMLYFRPDISPKGCTLHPNEGQPKEGKFKKPQAGIQRI